MAVAHQDQNKGIVVVQCRIIGDGVKHREQRRFILILVALDLKVQSSKQVYEAGHVHIWSVPGFLWFPDKFVEVHNNSVASGLVWHDIPCVWFW